MNAYIVDTTLRYMVQNDNITFKSSRKVRIAKLLDSMGVHQIEAGIPALSFEEMKSVNKIIELGLKSKVSSWNRLNSEDIEKSIECGAEIIHISIPSSNSLIFNKLGTTKEWVVDNLRRCTARCVEKGFKVTIGFEDASRAEMPFLLMLAASAFIEGAQVIRYIDAIGDLTREMIFERISEIKSSLPVEIEMYAHNGLGMAVANSIAAIRAGAVYVDCMSGCTDKYACNCDMLQFIKSVRACLGLCGSFDLGKVRETQTEIAAILG